MRYSLIIILLFSSCNSIENKETIELKNNIIGNWQLSNDQNFIVNITKDSIRYFYKETIKDKNPISIRISNNVSKYRTDDGKYDFMVNGELQSQITIYEYDSVKEDTLTHIIVFLDKNGMDLISRDQQVSFDKIQK